MSPLALVTFFALSVGACGGKISTDPLDPPAAPTASSPSPLPPTPTPTPPVPSPQPPPPVMDAAPREGTLVSGSPRCTKSLPTDGTSCKGIEGYVPKCEYAVPTDGGTCRWNCSCSSPPPATTNFLWSCSRAECN